MVIIFFNRGKGSGHGPADYLMGKDRNRKGAQVIRGDLNATVENINGLNFARNYTSGCLSFSERDISSHQKEKLMDQFELTIFAGLDIDQYDITWIQHQDKNRLELNFLIPNVELLSGKQYQPYYHRGEWEMLNALQTIWNDTHGFSDPNEPHRRRALTLPKDLPREKIQVLKSITNGLLAMASNGLLENRLDVIQTLSEAGFEVTNETRVSISVKDPQGGKNIKLKGALYERNFKNVEGLREKIEAASNEYSASREERVHQAEQVYWHGNKKKRARNEKRYARVKSSSLGTIQETKNSSIDNVISSLFLRGNGLSVESKLDQRRANIELKLMQELEKNDGIRATINAINRANARRQRANTTRIRGKVASSSKRLRWALRRCLLNDKQHRKQYLREVQKANTYYASGTRKRENMLRM